MKSNIVLALLLSSFSTTAIGQNPTPVIDLSSPILSSPPIENNVTRTADVTAAGDSYYQSQVLQEEVRMLRGLVEELSHELQQVKQRQMDDYLDLDRRLSALTAGNSAGQPAVQTRVAEQKIAPSPILPSDPSNTSSAASQATAPANSAEMKANYDNASDLLLKQRDTEGATLAFK